LLRPQRIALTIVGAYLVTGFLYIAVSGRIVSRIARSMEHLVRLETIKGFGFVVVTGLLLYLVIWQLLRRVAAQGESLERQRSALIASEQRATAATFAASTAHDINNALTIADGHATLIRDRASLSAEDRETVEKISRAIQDVTRLAENLLSLGKRENGSGRELRDITSIVREAADFARSHRRVRMCEVMVESTAPVMVSVDTTQLARAVLNLIINAADAAGAGGRIRLRVEEDGDDVRLEFHDDGPGIPPEQRDLVFEPFHTTKEDGSGLGLLSVRVFTEEHGGSVSIGESELGGACISLRIPRETEVPATP
jgi:two-component system sensor histidine kinase HydH